MVSFGLSSPPYTQHHKLKKKKKSTSKEYNTSVTQMSSPTLLTRHIQKRLKKMFLWPKKKENVI